MRYAERYTILKFHVMWDTYSATFVECIQELEPPAKRPSPLDKAEFDWSARTTYTTRPQLSNTGRLGCNKSASRSIKTALAEPPLYSSSRINTHDEKERSNENFLYDSHYFLVVFSIMDRRNSDDNR